MLLPPDAGIAPQSPPPSVTNNGPYSELPIEGELPAPLSEHSEIPDFEPVPYSEQTLIEGYEPVGTPDWSYSPYRRNGWRGGLTPFFSDDDDEFAMSAFVGYENLDGIGQRAEWWYFEEDNDEPFTIDFRATTLYFDYYKRHYYHRAELLLGAGPALGHQQLRHWSWGRENQFYGGGGSAVAEGFLPFWSGKKWDLGAIGQARVAALIGGGDDEFDTGSDGADWMRFVEEFGWGLEFRQRFGKNDSKSWYYNVQREVQLWGDADLPYRSNLIIQGTAVNVGVAW
jgi:hypothetical protein